jgi:uncharacterized protein with gpF-like domain
MPDVRLISPTGKRKELKPIHPNAGLEADYRRRLDRLIAEMQRSIVYWLTAQYRAKPPEMAQDDSPAAALRKTMDELGDRWQSKFDALAPEMAKYFATAAKNRVDGSMAAMLKKAGFTVKFKLTRPVNDVLQASIAEQVGLIKSIAAEHLQEVQGLVMRSVTAGRDLSFLTDELEKRYAITRRRAAFIARDQNNKAFATITRARQQEVGITRARWLHSHGGNKPRPTHVKAGADRVVYDVAKGWYDPAVKEFIWPGTLPNCRCISIPVVEGLA